MRKGTQGVIDGMKSGKEMLQINNWYIEIGFFLANSNAALIYVLKENIFHGSPRTISLLLYNILWTQVSHLENGRYRRVRERKREIDR